MDYTSFHAIESVFIFSLLNLANDSRFLGFYFKPQAAKDNIRKCSIEILLILTYCLLVVFAPCFIYSLKFVISHVCQTVKVTELTTVPFGETNHTCCAAYFFCSTS